MKELTSEELPSTLHELLRLGVTSAKECINDPCYHYDTHVLHRRGPGGRTSVNMSGAVVAKVMGYPPGHEFEVDLFVWGHRKIYALGLLEMGKVILATACLIGGPGRLWRVNGTLTPPEYAQYRMPLLEIEQMLDASKAAATDGARHSWGSYLQAADMLEELHHKHLLDQLLDRLSR